MLGGGTYVLQNKVLPGAYINFISARNVLPVLSDRGTAAVPLVFSWGPEKEVYEVTAEDFQKRYHEIFGYPYDAEEMWKLREVFAKAKKVYFYRMNKGVKASNDLAEAKYSGTRGNALKIVVALNVDLDGAYDVSTLLDNREVDKQTVTASSELKDNHFVVFKKDAQLAETAGMPLTGGTDGAEVTGLDHTDFLNAVEAYTFNTLCCPSTDETTKKLYIAFTKRLRDEMGIKFQTVMYQYEDADFEGIISVENAVETEGKEHGLVYWVTGAEAACEVNKTNENKLYDGELTVDTKYTQAQLSAAIQAGKFMFHKVGDDVRVLMDINTFISYTNDKNEDFSSNQTVRVLDQIGMDIASIFNTRYLGIVPNNASGRVSLWNDIVAYLKQLEKLQAIENLDGDSIKVDKGETKRAVEVSCPVTG